MDLQPPTRNNYFIGELLDADDFTAEQEYHVGKRRLLNRTAVGVGSPQTVDPRRPADDAGLAIPAEGSRQMTLYLCYAESGSGAEPAPGSEARQERIVEGFTMQVREGRPQAAVALSDRQREAIFPAAPHREFDRRAAACAALTSPCAIPDEACVVLATVTLLADGRVDVDECAGRVQLHSNAQLFDLILSLAEQVDRLRPKGRAKALAT